MAEKRDPKTKADFTIPTGVPESAFEEALRAVENLKKTQDIKPKKKADKGLSSEDDTEGLANLLKVLHLDDSEKPAPPARSAEPAAAPQDDKNDLDLLAKLLEEEQNLEKEAEFLKTVLIEAQTTQTPSPLSHEDIQKKEARIQELQDRLLRIQADFDNFKKRINRDKADMVRFSNENLILSILPIIDNFERAISHADATDDSQATIDGVRLILKQLQETLQANGVRKIDASDQVFDPTYHEAMATYATKDVEAGRVITQYEAGYLLHGRLLRPAKVVVATKPNSESERPAPPKNESVGASGS